MPEGTRQSVEHFKEVVNDKQLEIVLAFDEVIRHAWVELCEEEEGEGHKKGAKSVVYGTCEQRYNE